MSTGLASLAGYGSDSDEEETTPVLPPAPAASSSRLTSLLPPPKSTSLAAKLPAPSSAAGNPKSSGTSLSLPPPSASSSTAKRKVIKVGSLASLDDGDDDGEPDIVASGAKKPRLGMAASGSASSKHSLFGMLPAPKRRDDEVLAERKKEAQQRKADRLAEESEAAPIVAVPIQTQDDSVRSPSPGAMMPQVVEESTQDPDFKPKGKNNDAFRAMLGLKPAAKPPSTQPSQEPAQSKPVTGNQLPPPQPKQPSTVPDPGASVAKVEAAPLDFFSLEAKPPAKSSATQFGNSFMISAAPSIDQPSEPDEPAAQTPLDEYPGWQLDTDGSWVPVTPEAHAQLAAYEQSLAPPPTATSKGAANLDGTRDLLAAGLTPDDIRAFDASAAARDAYSRGGDDDADADKYAAAAEFAAGNRDAMAQRKPGMLKGLKKGQLSSLISLADENRSKAEEKWKRGRDARARRANQYGF
ncbi:hypothetical protein PANT_27c00078 [Moesziomyces antarcticus T-34]|uniref:Proline-rich protein PRCC n=1 Tax=Pseudozyma antarctica (strain T-34) TaxID=1151754 RepID=M9M1X5_PSEA3|nr:hypothetical protein PANT_27c00078 [Moesziomyces antarcticus T-34]